MPQAPLRQWTVDAFAREPFMGNPACVVEPFDAWPDDAWMQRLAAENNQAETAFLLRSGTPGRYGLRWFTPATEAPLCGHATLAAAHVLVAALGVDARTIIFDTLSGPLTVRCAGDLYEMDFPANLSARTDVPAGLEAALGVAVDEVWQGSFLVAMVADEAAVRAAAPDMAALMAFESGAKMGRGVVAVAALASDGRYDVVSRMFGPGVGIPEDPTTGSLHCMLAPLFGQKLSRDTLRFHQAYPGRGGDLECEWRGDRVLLRGAAVTVIESVLRL